MARKQSSESRNAPANDQNTPVKLSPEQAEILLRADLTNLAKKVQQGRTLSPTERNLLQSAIDGGRPSTASFVGSLVELSEILGVTRQSLHNYLRIEGNPGHRSDGRYDVNAWRVWVANRRGLDPTGEVSPGQLRARQILLQNEKLELQIAVMRKTYVAAEEVERDVAQMVMNAKHVLLVIPPSLAPQVIGLTAAEAERRLRDAINEALQKLHADPLGERAA